MEWVGNRKKNRSVDSIVVEYFNQLFVIDYVVFFLQRSSVTQALAAMDAQLTVSTRYHDVQWHVAPPHHPSAFHLAHHRLHHHPHRRHQPYMAMPVHQAPWE